MKDITKMFGSMVFSDEIMKQRLPQEVYQKLKEAVAANSCLPPEISDFVADAMKKWAVENGATHFTHWFQPMTEITAEKHNSFLEMCDDGTAKMSFSGKELVKGESDASSLPSGGLRETFEARGYTSWDPTSYAFIRNKSLYIPTFFCSYSRDILDEKTPLLKSMYALNKQSLRILRLLGDDSVSKVTPTIGAEQEYFLIDEEMYKKRKDLVFCGRTLFGAKPVKGQDLFDHYFCVIKPKIAEFMQEADEELWKLGVPSKVKHNEVAPSQHELTQIHTFSNVATDQNHIIMETLKSVAARHGMACLLHEKPFAGINGSGKHNNWSLSTDTGFNILEPGKSPRENVQFLVFLCAVIKAVDEYSDLLRVSISSPSNDCRLGGHEAPPSIVSMYLGDDISKILKSVERGELYNEEGENDFEIGLKVFPRFQCDTSDRNRTSPFAFTGNKFEFRMLGSSQSVASPNTILNTITAQALKEIADELESSSEPLTYLGTLLPSLIKKHKRVLFNGNSYSKEWVSEAEERGLKNFATTVDALACYLDKKNVKLFETHNVLTKREMESRYRVNLENYCKVINIEAKTIVSMIKAEVLPAASKYTHELGNMVLVKSTVKEQINCDYESNTLMKISELSGDLYKETGVLISVVQDAENETILLDKAFKYKNEVLASMSRLRSLINTLESIMPAANWPYPTYDDILFSV